MLGIEHGDTLPFPTALTFTLQPGDRQDRASNGIAVRCIGNVSYGDSLRFL